MVSTDKTSGQSVQANVGKRFVVKICRCNQNLIVVCLKQIVTRWFPRPLQRNTCNISVSPTSSLRVKSLPKRDLPLVRSLQTDRTISSLNMYCSISSFVIEVSNSNIHMIYSNSAHRAVQLDKVPRSGIGEIVHAQFQYFFLKSCRCQTAIWESPVSRRVFFA